MSHIFKQPTSPNRSVAVELRLKGKPRPGVSPLKVMVLMALMVGVLCGEAGAVSDFFHDGVSFQVRDLLTTGTPPLSLGGRFLALKLHPALAPFYTERRDAAVWIHGQKLSREAERLIRYLRSLSDEGLCPEDYRLAELEELLGVHRGAEMSGGYIPAELLATLDVLLSDAFLCLADDLIAGRVDPRRVHENWRFPKVTQDASRLLRFALSENAVIDVLEQLKPSSPSYRRLVAALARYRDIAARGGWPRIPDGAVVRPGDSDPRMPLLVVRLAISGDLAAGEEITFGALDAPLRRALIRFQERHGLEGDGVLGAKTLQALNVTVDERIRQIEVNLERLRWLPKNLGLKYLVVNIPDMMLTVMEEDHPVLWMPVVVGRALRETPVFSARMTYLVFSPFWHVPATIFREDKLPKIRKDAKYLEKNHFEIIPWSKGEDGEEVLDPRSIDWNVVEADSFPAVMRQHPGPWNPLGQVKFMFPNPDSIYLHDTNEPWLFSRNQRLFSSGCIRIQRPLDLAQYLLEEEGWSCEKLLNATALFHPHTVLLPEPLPVYLLYQTAWAARDGSVQFRNDLYFKDMMLDYLLGLRNRRR
ncbi:MAG: L,D-transpeptidase family protein [Deltaproteobacteria bacterium]|nr:L,D-transpeptidase family protein [Deltaproteobacteria bacterium]